MSCPLEKRRTRTDRRLLGQWRSDREKTFSQWIYPEKLARPMQRRFESLFGQLKIRFTPSYVYMDYQGEETRLKYSVIWANSTSCMVEYENPEEHPAQHVVFEGHYYSVRVGNNVEYFRRITPKSKPRPRKSSVR